MSLLEVYVIFGYYNKFEKNFKYNNKITKQKFDNDFIVSKIKELSNYQSSALHWNLKELRETLPLVIQKQKDAYARLAIQAGVTFKSFQAFAIFKNKLETDVNLFMESSRKKAQQAQYREVITIHGKEYLETLTKASITITNYLGGKYFFTVDEILISNEEIFLIESKHSNTALLPSIADIKDGLLKMILYSNLSQVYENNKNLTPKPVLKLTSLQIKGSITSNSSYLAITDFYKINKLSQSAQVFVRHLFNEAIQNNFLVQIVGQL